MKRYLYGLWGGLIWLGACSTPSVLPENPFSPFRPDSIGSGDTITHIPGLSRFSGLHAQVFEPTCANSGCHDGTFEPDFRTIESSYNTLVYHAIIKNDTAGGYTYRVEPGQPEQSVLWNRLTQDIDGQSGLMPLVVDVGNPWEAQKDSLLDAIRTWITEGAPDMYGNLPQRENLAPYVVGMVAFQAGSQVKLDRETSNSPIRVLAANRKLTLWFAVKDDLTPPQDLLFNKVRLSPYTGGFDTLPAISLQVVPPIKETGFSGEFVEYFHRVDLDLSSFKVGTTLFMRIYVQDPQASFVTEIPTQGSSYYIHETFALEII